MKKFCWSLIFLVMFCATASADIIYTTAEGGLGLIKVGGVTSASLTGITYNGNANSVAAPYWENNTSNGEGNSKIIFITPKSSDDNTISGDTALRFSSGSSLTAPLDKADNPLVLNGTYGTPVICGTNSGGSLYLATGASVREYKTANFSLYNTYTHPSYDVSLNPEIKSILKTDANIYLLTARNSAVSNDLMLVMNGLLTLNTENASSFEIPTKTSKTAAFISDSRIAVGCDEGIWNAKSSNSTKLVSTDYPVVSICQDSSSGFYYIVQSEDNAGNKLNSLRHYVNTTTDTELLNNIQGSSAQLVRDNAYSVLAVLIGNTIKLYNIAEDTEITISGLTGTPISIAPISTSGNSADSSSGCMTGGTGAALLAALALALKHKRK